MRRIPVILDTDIGSDIDDALALSYLLGQPECELVGVTTVTGDTGQRAALAHWLCDVQGKPHMPVVAGLRGPLLHGPGQPNVPQFAACPETVKTGFGDPSGHQAIEFLRTSIRKRPHEITLLAVGPLTNIAALFLADPEIPKLVDRIVLMSGVFGTTDVGKTIVAEWNVRCDALASAIVYHHARPGSLLAVGLDVTLHCKESAQRCREQFGSGSPALQASLKMAEVWFKNAGEVYFHDPLATALIFDSTMCDTQRGTVTVDVSGGPRDGATPFIVSSDGPHQVASAVRPASFFENYYRFTRPSKP